MSPVTSSTDSPIGSSSARRVVGVLLGQRLGGSHHRALTAGLDRAHERVRGDDRLARAHVSEQKPAHRTRAGEVPLELGDHPALSAREGERQPAVVAAGELARRGQGHRRRGGVELAPATQQRELEQQELLVREPAPGGARLILVARRVQCGERVAAERKVAGHAQFRRQWLGHRVEAVQVPHRRGRAAGGWEACSSRRRPGRCRAV